ncbi:MAG: SDR family oxidoreductase [Polaribacter sp.]|uniref:SDR family oxidoreductase n=1 Tax=Polaribacter sp. TaxID=1920175 RepID=UPI0026016364|nr:SDR family oxidoreductase [Polaribacter sp.]MBT3741913.1 SDR family oxidoreductase [Polaribacter sp.]MBT4413663.1 SDR family oxidoreductase [Polaribacter sp.]MDG1196190.1 SDR family oxidoreductase [Polaribacter sp.]MDG1402407.1 SDR family oxidoreductase [Polaribacter sp.]
MKILVTGATGYIGKRLIPLLLNDGHIVVCAVRDKDRAKSYFRGRKNIELVEADFLSFTSLESIPKDIDFAYYLIHSMSNSAKEFHVLEEKCAFNFKRFAEQTTLKQVIYLSGITNDTKLSKHLLSRKNVENTLASKKYALTTFKAGIIVGSGSSSFEIIRDLVEKLPAMIAPKWLDTKTQPLGIRDVLSFLHRAIGKKKLYNKSFDVFGPEVLTYKEMLLQFSEVRKLKRWIYTVPIMTPKLSSYWLYFVTSTSYKLASTLVNSMGVEVIGKKSDINKILDVQPMSYKQAVEFAFVKIKQNSIISSWKDSYISSGKLKNYVHEFINVPKHGCFKDFKKRKVENRERTLNRIWAIGGETGWYYGTFLWKIRGFIDQFYGGAGLRRGRRHPSELNAGDALDFWRVIYADKEKGKLLLYAEMILPGEAWLEFKIEEGILCQTATFRPHGLAGRLYWYAVMPFHWFVFNGMINNINK